MIPSPYIMPGLNPFHAIKKDFIPYKPVFASLFPRNVTASMADIEQIVCAEYRMAVSKIHVRSNRAHEVRVRQICIHFMYKYCDTTLKAISEYFGYADHTTAMHSRNTISDYYDTQKVLRRKMDKIELDIKIKFGSK